MVRGLTSRALPPLQWRSHRTGSHVSNNLQRPQGSLTSTSHPHSSPPCSASQLRRPWTRPCALSPCHRCLDSSSTRGPAQGLLPRCAPWGARPKTRAAARRDDRARLTLIPEGSRRSPTLPSRLVEGLRVRERSVRWFPLAGSLGRGPCNRTSSSAATRSAKCCASVPACHYRITASALVAASLPDVQGRLSEQGAAEGSETSLSGEGGGRQEIGTIEAAQNV